MQTIPVGTKDRQYNIQVGHGILPALGDHCRGLGLGKSVALITDESVASVYMEPVTASLATAGFAVTPVVFSGGDRGKSLEAANDIYSELIEAELDRGAWVIALGGGVVGDMAGFIAATYLRGIPYVQVPTTIVSQVDASIGGKTAVNHRLGKNLIGAFHQPSLVYVDTAALHSLPREELAAGMAEVVKHAVIRDAGLFEFLEDNLERILDLDLEADLLDWLIARNVEIKVAVVQEDEREGGLRAILNYGHTIGHAIEAATDYVDYRHGEAVILGMIGAGQIALTQGFWDAAERDRQDALLARLGVPVGIDRVSAEEIVARTRSDKKRVGGRTRLILGRKIGQVEIVDHFGEDELRNAVDYLQSSYGGP